MCDAILEEITNLEKDIKTIKKVIRNRASCNSNDKGFIKQEKKILDDLMKTTKCSHVKKKSKTDKNQDTKKEKGEKKDANNSEKSETEKKPTKRTSRNSK